MPLLDDINWQNSSESNGEFDECGFLGFQTTSSGTDVVNGKVSPKPGIPSSAQKRRRSRKKIKVEDASPPGASIEKKLQTATSRKSNETNAIEDETIQIKATPSSLVTKQKRRKLESPLSKESVEITGNWGGNLRQRTQVFHYFKVNEKRRAKSLSSSTNGDEVTQSGIHEVEITDSVGVIKKELQNNMLNGKQAEMKLSKKKDADQKLEMAQDRNSESETDSNLMSPSSNVDIKSEDLINKNEVIDSESECEIKNIQSKKPNKLPTRSRSARKSKKKFNRLLVAERSNTPDGIWLSVSRSPSPVSNEIVETSDNGNGVVVWAKLAKYPWWPAIIINGEDCSRQPAPEGTQWIFWLGDHKISKLATNQMVEFVTNYKSKINERGSKQYVRSVNEALFICATRCGVNLSLDDSEGLLKWAKEGFTNQSPKVFPFGPILHEPIPEFIRRRQEKIRKTCVMDKLLCDSTTTYNLSILSERECIPSAISKVKAGQIKITEMCLACDSVEAAVVVMHPVFEGGLCKNCKEELRETVYAIGEDGTSSYCAICGSPGELIICDNPGCSKVYCSSCINLYAADGQLDKVVNASPWICYFCLEYDPKVHGFLRRAENLELNIIQLFHTESHVNLYPEPSSFTKKRPIRVLSLFDGIGTGRLVLDRLNIEVEVYYSSEIDTDSILVASVRHKVTQLGNVESLSDVEIARLCPFDLLIGGSPCNDLSLVNPIRKGLYDPTGTGKLFFDYFRILKAIQINNKNNHLFWLFENVASMPHEYRDIISRFLQCEPSMIDSKYFSPQNRARYYWGNIPGLYNTIPSSYVEQDITLQSIITPGCSRKALVDKVRCITTRSNSLVQKGGSYPVEMNGKQDSLWINELEKAFGFPEHHTDIGNLSFNRRQHLLGRAWTVPVIEYILKPLKNFFKVKNVSSHHQTPSTTPSKTGNKCWSPPSSSLIPEKD